MSDTETDSELKIIQLIQAINDDPYEFTLY